MVEWGKVSMRSSYNNNNNNKLIAVAATVLLLCVCVAAGQGWYCGRAANTLMHMCDSCYASLDKRSTSKSTYTPASKFDSTENTAS